MLDNDQNPQIPTQNQGDINPANDAAFDAAIFSLDAPTPLSAHIPQQAPLPAPAQPSAVSTVMPNPQPTAPVAPPLTRHAIPQTDAVFHIETDKIKPNPHQPRRVFDEDALHDLANSIREFGVLQPLVVTQIHRDSENGRTVEYELIAGERRLMASRLAGIPTVPVIVRRGVTSDKEKLELAIIENIQRENLNPIEQAKSFARLQDEFKLTQREIGVRLGKSREVIANAMRLLNLPTEIQDAVGSGKLSESQARMLLTIDDIPTQKQFFADILNNNLSVREIRLRIARSKEKAQPQEASADPESMAIKERLEEALGTKVDLKQDGDTGKITIAFYSQEELRALLQKLGGHTN